MRHTNMVAAGLLWSGHPRRLLDLVIDEAVVPTKKAAAGKRQATTTAHQ